MGSSEGPDCARYLPSKAVKDRINLSALEDAGGIKLNDWQRRAVLFAMDTYQRVHSAQREASLEHKAVKTRLAKIEAAARFLSSQLRNESRDLGNEDPFGVISGNLVPLPDDTDIPLANHVARMVHLRGLANAGEPDVSGWSSRLSQVADYASRLEVHLRPDRGRRSDALSLLVPPLQAVLAYQKLLWGITNDDDQYSGRLFLLVEAALQEVARVLGQLYCNPRTEVEENLLESITNRRSNSALGQAIVRVMKGQADLEDIDELMLTLRFM